MPFKDSLKRKEYMKGYMKEYNQRPGQAEKNRVRQKRHSIKIESKEKRAKHQKDPVVMSAKREWGKHYRNKNKYGLSKEHYDRLLREQLGCCAICGSSEWGGRYNTPYVDHDHTNGAIRGLLCYYCNVAGGMVRDDPKIARKLAEHIERYR
jgi:hypothetical protein